MDAIRIAGSGLAASLSRHAAAASSVVRASLPGGSAELADAAVDLIRAGHDVKVNAAVVKRADETLGSLLDVLA